MTKPTHTHKNGGGRFAVVAEASGIGNLNGQAVVIYRDLGKEVQNAIDKKIWEELWRPIATDDCPVCLGSGHDQIKGRKDKPCGGCFGLGKVKEDGETPADRWELAEVAAGIIQRQQLELDKLRQLAQLPGVQAAIQAHKDQAISDSVARQEQKWRAEPGHGPGGRRYTGD